MACRSISPRASSWPCSVRRAAARPRRCARSRAWSGSNSGRVLLDGRDITHTPASRRDMGMVFQAYSLFPHLTARENVAFGLRLRRKASAERGRVGGPPARPRAPRGQGPQLPARALRRPAAARGAGPGARDRAAGAAAGRAALGAGCQGARPAARRDPPDSDRGRDHHPVRDPRSGRGARDRRSRGGHLRRPSGADRAAGRALRASPIGAGRRLRRPLEPAARRGRARHGEGPGRRACRCWQDRPWTGR